MTTTRLGDDDRVLCVDCRHYRPNQCGNHKRAQLKRPDVSRAMALLPQLCPGFEQRAAHA